jgi:ubiquinone/menaquinone biosynthesis C-methylase UbiE
LFEGFPITADDVVLESGCGEGEFAEFCASQGATLIVTDIDPARVARVEQRLVGTAARSVRGIVSDGDPLPLPDSTASVVICMEVLEHVDDAHRFLSELVRVGQPGARYFLTVPDPVCETVGKSVAHPSHFEKPNHIRIIQRDEFAAMVEAAGLIVEKRAANSFYWSLWWILFWACKGIDLSDPRHPILASWTKTWNLMLDTPNGPYIKKALDELMPKSQIIIARKP